MRKVDNGKKEKKKEKIMTFMVAVATNVVAKGINLYNVWHLFIGQTWHFNKAQTNQRQRDSTA